MPESRLKNQEEKANWYYTEFEKYKCLYEQELYKRIPSLMKSEEQARYIRLTTDCAYLERKVAEQEEEILRQTTENNKLKMDKMKLKSQIKKCLEDNRILKLDHELKVKKV